jgi:hypothetical protein
MRSATLARAVAPPLPPLPAPAEGAQRDPPITREADGSRVTAGDHTMADHPEILLIAGGKIIIRPDQMAEAAKAQRPKILLVTDKKTVHLEMGRDGKFFAKPNAWEENKLVPEGEELMIQVEGGRWLITKHPPPYRLAGAPGADLDLDDISAATADYDVEV